MGIVTKQLCKQRPDDPQWPISLAYATRRAHSLDRAFGILMGAVEYFPEDAIMQFNLACYEAQLGNVEAAHQRLDRLIDRKPAFLDLALGDSDLEMLWPLLVMRE
jgi:predicted Zn-dependent protease